MATVRIYKVADLLGTTSQEVMALLKRDYDIDAKGASSTIEEVVARQFVEKLARQRDVALPGGDMFEETTAAKGRKPAPPKKAEPPKPIPLQLGPPRLRKKEHVATPTDTEQPTDLHEAPDRVEEPDGIEREAAPVATLPVEPEVPTPPPAPAPPAPLEPAAVAPEVSPAAVVVEAPEPEPVPVEAPPAQERVSVEAVPPPPPAPKPVVGRVVPPRGRINIETHPPSSTPPLSALTPRVPPRVVPKPAQPQVRQAAGVVSGQPVSGGPRPPALRPGMVPPSSRPMYPSRPPAPGGSRPIPSPPVRTAPPPMPGRPNMPGRPPFRPPMRPVARTSGPRPDRPPRQMSSESSAPPSVTRTITLAEGMTVKDLADKLEVKPKDVLQKLFMKRLVMSINAALDTDTATMIAREFGADVQMRSFEEELQVGRDEQHPEDVITRAPVVTVMGHVDHGKTSLLDAIRETRVAEREAGGITQHIGAYHVTIKDRDIVFLDTPGHEAFTLMRARGAKVTDIVVLVVAADDGVMPQTKEAIDHARAANVPIVVAINKIDKPGANPERVKRELTELNLMPEDWGGQTVTVEVSAKKRQNIEGLLEMILLVSDIGEFKANPKRDASGTVLEAKLDKGRGPVATILVQDGTLRVGDTFIAGPIVGRVRALIDDRGRPTKSAGPSTPVEVLGLTGLPQPGDAFQALADAAKARQIATFRQEQAKSKALGTKGSRLTLESLQAQIAEGGMKELPIIIKADVQGSMEVLGSSLQKLSDEKVKIRIVHAGVGAINESDVLLASASNAIVIGFNVRPDRNAQDLVDREHVDVRLHSVIYNVTDEMKKAMTGLLEPTFKEVRLGIAAVRSIFKVPKFGTIAGCMVTEGRISRAGDTQARLIRDSAVVYEGKIGSLRRFKDDVSEVKSGFECGIGFDKYNDLKVGDVIEVFTMERMPITA